MTTYSAGNLAWQLGGDALLVRSLAEDADVLALVECRTKDNDPVDVQAILGDGWWVWQNLRSGALAGTAIAVRKAGSVKRRRVAGALSKMVQIADPGRDLQARYLRSVKLRDEDGPLTVLAAHLPLKSTGQQEAAMGRVRWVWITTPGRKVMFADGNQPPNVFAAGLTAAAGLSPHSSGSGVMVTVWSRNWNRVKVLWEAFIGSDHKTAKFTNASQR